MKIFGCIKDNEHVVTCECGAIIKYSDKDIISENVVDVDYWGVNGWTEKSIICKSCNRKIRFR
jgi:RNase P subunit RPR2